MQRKISKTTGNLAKTQALDNNLVEYKRILHLRASILATIAPLNGYRDEFRTHEPILYR